MCLSKGLTGGTLPLGLTLCTQEIYNAFLSDDNSKTFFHGHSFTGNPISCAVACASLDLLEKQETQTQIQEISKFHTNFSQKISSVKKIKNIRQTGTILAIEINTNENSSYFNSIRDSIYSFFLNRNILLRPLGNVLYIIPPYSISENELNEIYSSIEAFIDQF